MDQAQHLLAFSGSSSPVLCCEGWRVRGVLEAALLMMTISTPEPQTQVLPIAASPTQTLLPSA